MKSVRKLRGAALIFAVIFTAVVLSIGISLADISYKQVILTSLVKQSSYAFYAADAGLECVLEMDQQYDTFDLSTEPIGTNAVNSPIYCEGQSFPSKFTSSGTQNSQITTTIQIPCPTGSNTTSNATVYVYKSAAGYVINGNTYHALIYANGFNNCNASDPARVERGIIARY